MACRIFALAQQKGGVGKTTTAINLGATLRERGRRVLLLDLDPQGALSAGLGLDPLSLDRTIYDVLRSARLDIVSVVRETDSGCDLVPANIDLAAAEIELVSEPGREQILKGKMESIAGKYDYILIDCPPSLSLLTLNALTAAHNLIIPVQTQYFALRGMDLLFSTVEKVRARLNPKLKIAGILPTMYDSRTTHGKEVLEELRETYGAQLFETVIPLTVKLADSAMAGQSIISFHQQSPAAAAYRALALEVEKRVH